MPDTGPISIYHWNVNGIGPALDKGKFQEFIEATDPDIVCLNETKTDTIKIHEKLWS